MFGHFKKLKKKLNMSNTDTKFTPIINATVIDPTITNATIVNEISEPKNNHSYIQDICNLFGNCCCPIVYQCNNEFRYIINSCSCLCINYNICMKYLFPYACYEDVHSSFFSTKCFYISDNYCCTGTEYSYNSDVYCYMKDKCGIIKCCFPCLWFCEGCTCK